MQILDRVYQAFAENQQAWTGDLPDRVSPDANRPSARADVRIALENLVRLRLLEASSDGAIAVYPTELGKAFMLACALPKEAR